MWYALGGLLLLWALWFLLKRLIRFIRTGGQSACENCPYSGKCSGHCAKK